MFPRVEAHDFVSPGLFAVRAGKSQLVQRDLHLNHIAVFVDLTCRAPDSVPGVILVVIDVVVGQIHLHTEWIGEKLECASIVVVGVEDDADNIVGVS